MSDLSRVGSYHVLAFCLLGNFACIFFAVDFFQNQLFLKIPSGANQFGSRSGPTFCRVQTICKSRQQTTFILIVGRAKPLREESVIR